jgi:cytochrome c biogenesis protein CcmG/thiol:disulfide interchange protein DsbE
MSRSCVWLRHRFVARVLAPRLGEGAEVTVPPLSHSEDAAASPVSTRRFRPLFLLPVVGFVGLVAALALGLEHDPRRVPSPLIGKPVPVFALPPVAGNGPGLASSDLVGKVSLVNVFASWCVSCRDEHPLLLRLARAGIVALDGIDYKDKPADAARWLAAMGDPYGRIGADRDGRVAIDWGVYGVPETFVVDRRGFIAFKEIGPLTPAALENRILPLVERLREAPAPGADR